MSQLSERALEAVSKCGHLPGGYGACKACIAAAIESAVREAARATCGQSCGYRVLAHFNLKEKP